VEYYPGHLNNWGQAMKSESSDINRKLAIDLKLATWFGIRNLNWNHQWIWNQVPWINLVSDATILENMPMESIHRQTNLGYHALWWCFFSFPFPPAKTKRAKNQYLVYPNGQLRRGGDSEAWYGVYCLLLYGATHLIMPWWISKSWHLELI
jgi:hypothetical protein